MLQEYFKRTYAHPMWQDGHSDLGKFSLRKGEKHLFIKAFCATGFVWQTIT